MPAATRPLLCVIALYLAGCASTPPTSNTIPARLVPWQGTLTAEEWQIALDERFAPKGAGAEYITVTPNALIVKSANEDSTPFFSLPTRAANAPELKPVPDARYWHTRAELGPAPANKPLTGLRIALDPGHLGGEWGPMEGRSFRMDDQPPVQEGDLTLRVAQLLAPRLEALGAQVVFVRDQAGPVTDEKITEVHPANRTEIQKFLGDEIRMRSLRVNDLLHPDLVLCLHFDAAEWPDPEKPSLVDGQHFHILVNGAYLPAEIAKPEQRLAMLERIADGAGAEELAVAQAMAEAAGSIFQLPTITYTGANAVALGGNGYVWGRNLEANRIYRCPVVYFEPYVANSVEGYERIQAGEYAGTREFNGVARKNVFEEYCDAVVAGLVNYYGKRSAAAQPKPR